MTLSVKLGSLLLTSKEYARFTDNQKWLEGLLRGFPVGDFLGLSTNSLRPCVIMYGSSVSGTAFQKADIDYSLLFLNNVSTTDLQEGGCLNFSQSEFIEVGRSYHKQVLLSVLEYMKREVCPSEVMQYEQVFSARVPVLRVWKSASDKADNLYFDMSMSLDGPRNSLLLRLYMKSDPRLRAGVLCIKRWCHSQGILDARRGWISPYALTVMYIFYMQVTKRTTQIIDENDVDKLLNSVAKLLRSGDGGNVSDAYGMLPYEEADMMVVFDDLRNFFSFFGECERFDFDNDVVDIRTRGKLLSKEAWVEEIKQLDEKERWKLMGYETMLIRDPYENHNLGRGVDFFRGEKIREVFRLSSKLMCGDIFGFLLS
uniref:RNA uridylyltransferase n=1 Tax=Trypanosoma congolense (strain IL3000) TaxID=1068625 RepID=G0UV30_TRYCI|nr:conserved hypothetical protein [Trypanosoma congolense IL3000]